MILHVDKDDNLGILEKIVINVSPLNKLCWITL